MISDILLDAEGAKELYRSIYSILDNKDLNFKDEVEDRNLDISKEKIGNFINRLDLEDKDDNRIIILYRVV